MFFTKFLFKNPHTERAASAVEFGLIAPVFITFLLGTFELGQIMIIQNALEAAAREASRFGITGLTDTSMTRDQAIAARIQEIAGRYSGGLIKPGTLTITVKQYADLMSVGRPEAFTDMNKDGIYQVGEAFTDTNKNGVFDLDQGVTNSFGIGGQAVNYQITYKFNSFVGTLFGKSLITITGRTPVLNEDFS